MNRYSDFYGLFRRILSRSGYLTFSNAVDGSEQGNSLSPPPRLAWAMALAEPIIGRRIVDVGCWTGDLLKMLVPFEPAELVGIDVSGPWLHRAEKMVPSARFLGVANLADLPSELDSHFNVVMFLETLEHLPRGSERLALRSLASVLEPNGTLILSTPNAGIPALLDPAWFLVGHRHYRLRTLTELLSSAGLKVQSVYYSGNLWSSLDTIAMYLAKHIFGRSHSTPKAIASRERAGIYKRRRLDSSNVWVEACRQDRN
jgi:2-polyprenyl-3-methyl-5-hydroxy-6-metoxy-1,4-benzoquinol methylase